MAKEAGHGCQDDLLRGQCESVGHSGAGGGGQCASAEKDARKTVLGKELGVFTWEQGGLEPRGAGVRPEGDGAGQWGPGGVMVGQDAEEGGGEGGWWEEGLRGGCFERQASQPVQGFRG